MRSGPAASSRGGVDAREVPQRRARIGVDQIGEVTTDVCERRAIAADLVHRGAAANVNVEPLQPPVRDLQMRLAFGQELSE